MTPDELFQIASRAALTGRLLLGLGLLAPRPWAERALNLGGRVIPVGLCLPYVATLGNWWGSATGGFDSLDGVASLFAFKGLLLSSGWRGAQQLRQVSA